MNTSEKTTTVVHTHDNSRLLSDVIGILSMEWRQPCWFSSALSATWVQQGPLQLQDCLIHCLYKTPCT